MTADLRRKLSKLDKERRDVKRALNAGKPPRVIQQRTAPVAPGQREPRERNNAFLQFIRRQPCETCGVRRRVQAAHVRSGYPEAGWRPTGMQEKPSDWRVLPLCAPCHLEGPGAQHRSNEREWWAARGIYPPARCEELRELFEKEGKVDGRSA